LEQIRKPRLKTAVGNRIDDRLALGLARDFIGRIEREADEANRRRDPNLRVMSVRERRDALTRIRDSMGPLFIGMTSQKKFRQALMASYAPVRLGKGPVDTLAVRLDWMDFGRPGSRGAYHKKAWPVHTTELSSIIRIHAISRYIQRTGHRDPEELFPLLKRAAKWSSIARSFNVPGSWMLPVEDGLICAGSLRWTDGLGGEAIRVPVIRTFIARDNFRPRNAEVWGRLVDAGALELNPSLLTENTDRDLFRVWDLMRQEGMAWDQRREYAKRLRDERTPRATAEVEEEVGLEDSGDPEPA
jgi:hypothetical protein